MKKPLLHLAPGVAVGQEALAGCISSPAAARTEEMIAAVHAAGWNSHDLSALARMIHEDAQILVSPLLEPVGRAAYIGWQELFFQAFPEVNMSTVRSYSGKGWAVSEVRIKGTNTRPLPRSGGER